LRIAPNGLADQTGLEHPEGSQKRQNRDHGYGPVGAVFARPRGWCEGKFGLC
jgi:hypothetical protein